MLCIPQIQRSCDHAAARVNLSEVAMYTLFSIRPQESASNTITLPLFLHGRVENSSTASLIYHFILRFAVPNNSDRPNDVLRFPKSFVIYFS